MRLRVSHPHSRFLSMLTHFMDYYSVLGSRSDFHCCQTWGAFTCQSSSLTILANSGLFPGLLLTVSGPEVISMTNETRGAFTCRSSTLIVLADSCPFHGLLLSVLGSQSDFHGCRTLRCAYVSVINTRGFSRFLPVSWTITQFWGLEAISMVVEPRGAFTC